MDNDRHDDERRDDPIANAVALEGVDVAGLLVDRIQEHKEHHADRHR